jgi:hypothetical protein
MARSDQAILAPTVTARVVPVKRVAVFREELEKTMGPLSEKILTLAP